MELAEFIKKWESPKNPTAFSGIDILKKGDKNLPSKAVILKEYLPNIPTYQKFRTLKKPRQYNPYFVYTKRKIIQSDLLHMQHPKGIVKKNNGYAYILVVQDIFSRKVWARAIQNKSAQIIIAELQTILNEMKPFKKGARFVIDRGTEYLNQLVKKLLEKYGLIISHPSDGHASHVERSILSLQRLLYQQMHADGNSLKWVDKLPRAIEKINDRYHRIIRMSPNKAELKANQSTVNEAMSLYRSKAYRPNKSKRAFNIGNYVRIHKWKNKFTRGYKQSFSTEVFKIHKILDHLPITMYSIVDMNNEQIIGNFYPEELSLVKGDRYIVEKVIKTQVKKGKKWFLVKWEGFPSSENSWVKKEDLI